MSPNLLGALGVHNLDAPDDRLLSQAQSGDRRAFAELCQRYNAMVKGRILSMVRHREDAEDVLQETFLSAYQHLHSFRGKCKFSTWMMKIGINRSLMWLRKKKSRSRTTCDVVTFDGQTVKEREFRDPKPDPEQRYISDQTHEQLNLAIQRLPPYLRSTIELRYEKERSVKDIAETLGITQAATKSRILRARNRLRRSLESMESLTLKQYLATCRAIESLFRLN
jgi:RNA polymerase sigma-70 factor (ECF subfamily)